MILHRTKNKRSIRIHSGMKAQDHAETIEFLCGNFVLCLISLRLMTKTFLVPIFSSFATLPPPPIYLLFLCYCFPYVKRTSFFSPFYL